MPKPFLLISVLGSSTAHKLPLTGLPLILMLSTWPLVMMLTRISSQKIYQSDGGGSDAAHRYSQGRIRGIEKRVMWGEPDEDLISTSFVERANLTVRMHQRRFTRLTNAFSKKLENHQVAVSLHVGYYNFVHVHETLRVSPAMEVGATGHIWSI